MSPTFTTRRWQPGDEPFLWEMLYQSIHVREGHAQPPRSVLEEPDIADYLSGFGREGDDAQLAFDDGGRPIGAAWCRRMTHLDPGYGFVADDIPELGTAVVGDVAGPRCRHGADRAARGPTSGHQPQCRQRQRPRQGAVRAARLRARRGGGNCDDHASAAVRTRPPGAKSIVASMPCR